MSKQPDTLYWLNRLKEGDPEAIEHLWENYFTRLARFAQAKLARGTRSINDEEDVALSALNSFCRGVSEGRFPRLNDRDDLWKLLISITRNKLYRSIRDQHRQKRGGGWQPIPLADPEGDQYDFLQSLAMAEPTPEMAAQSTEECESMLNKLSDPTLVELALLKLEGHTNGEIAQRWGKAERTVERKLQLIRRLWTVGVPGDNHA